MRVLLKDLSAAYNASVAGSAPALPPLPGTYADFAAWQRAQAGSGAWDASLAYWRGRLLGAPAALSLPYKRSSGAAGGGKRAGAGPGAALPLALSADVVSGLNALAARAGTTLFGVLTAALAALLMRFCDQAEVTLGAPTSGREHRPGLMGQVGYYVNTMVLRLAADPEAPFSELLAAARGEVRAATQHGAVPYQLVVSKALGSAASPFQASSGSWGLVVGGTGGAGAGCGAQGAGAAVLPASAASCCRCCLVAALPEHRRRRSKVKLNPLPPLSPPAPLQSAGVPRAPGLPAAGGGGL